MTSRKLPPAYDGITGFMSRAEVDEVLDEVPDHPNVIMIGVLASSKTLAGRTAGNPNRYPYRVRIGEIFPPKSPRTLNLIHFNTRDRHRLRHWLDECVLCGGPNLDGIQINIAWPDPYAILDWREQHASERLQLVLQIGAAAIEALDGDACQIAKRVAQNYAVDYVLLDGSCGTGKELDPAFTRAFFCEMLARDKGIGLGVAGGLCAESVPRLLPQLCKDFHSYSIDTETKVRTPADALDTRAAVSYLNAAAALG